MCVVGLPVRKAPGHFFFEHLIVASLRVWQVLVCAAGAECTSKCLLSIRAEPQTAGLKSHQQIHCVLQKYLGSQRYLSLSSVLIRQDHQSRPPHFCLFFSLASSKKQILCVASLFSQPWNLHHLLSRPELHRIPGAKVLEEVEEERYQNCLKAIRQKSNRPGANIPSFILTSECAAEKGNEKKIKSNLSCLPLIQSLRNFSSPFPLAGTLSSTKRDLDTQISGPGSSLGHARRLEIKGNHPNFPPNTLPWLGSVQPSGSSNRILWTLRYLEGNECECNETWSWWKRIRMPQ